MIILVGGVPRSGKTIFCNRLAKAGISHMPGDSLLLTIQNQFPDSDIGKKESGVTHDQRCDKFLPFLTEFCRQIEMEYHDKNHFCLDTYYIRSEDVIDIHNVKVVFFGYPNVRPIDKLGEIRRFAKAEKCWSTKMDDDSLTEFVEKIYRTKQSSSTRL